jgi:L-lactate dehydrogenase complex protein LldF
MKIPLPDLLRKLRERQFERGLRPLGERLGLAAWGFLARRPSLYRISTLAASRLLRWFAGTKAHLRHVPGAGAWTQHRDFAAPSGKPFSAQWAQRQSSKTRP